MSSIDYFFSSIQGNANKRDYVKKYVINALCRGIYSSKIFIIDIHFISKQIWQTTLYDT